MTVSLLNTLKAELARKGPRITETGVYRLMQYAKDEFTVDRDERAWLANLLN